MIDAIKDFGKEMEKFLSVQTLSQSYKPKLEQYKAKKDLEEKINDLTGESIPTVNDEEYRDALAASALLKNYAKETVKYVKTNLGSIVGDLSDEQLLSVMTKIHAKSGKYEELTKKFEDYMLYSIFLDKNIDSEEKAKDKNAATAKIVNDKLKGMIYERIKGKFDVERAKLWADYLSAISTKEYVETVVKDAYNYLKTDLTNEIKNKGTITNYIQDSLSKDEEYLGLGMMINEICKSDKKKEN